MSQDHPTSWNKMARHNPVEQIRNLEYTFSPSSINLLRGAPRVPSESSCDGTIVGQLVHGLYSRPLEEISCNDDKSGHNSLEIDENQQLIYFNTSENSIRAGKKVFSAFRSGA